MKLRIRLCWISSTFSPSSISSPSYDPSWNPSYEISWSLSFCLSSSCAISMTFYAACDVMTMMRNLNPSQNRNRNCRMNHPNSNSRSHYRSHYSMNHLMSGDVYENDADYGYGYGFDDDDGVMMMNDSHFDCVSVIATATGLNDGGDDGGHDHAQKKEIASVSVMSGVDAFSPSLWYRVTTPWIHSVRSPYLQSFDYPRQ